MDQVSSVFPGNSKEVFYEELKYLGKLKNASSIVEYMQNNDSAGPYLGNWNRKPKQILFSYDLNSEIISQARLNDFLEIEWFDQSTNSAYQSKFDGRFWFRRRKSEKFSSVF